MSTLADKWLKKGLSQKYHPPSTFIALLWKRNFGFIQRKLVNTFLEIAEFLILSLICDQKYLEQIIGLTILQIIFSFSMESLLTINRRLAFHKQLIKLKNALIPIMIITIISAVPLIFYQGGSIILAMILYRFLLFIIQTITFVKTIEAQSTRRIYISPWKIFLPKILGLSMAFPFILKEENHLSTLIIVLLILLIGKCKSEFNFYRTVKKTMDERNQNTNELYDKIRIQNLFNETISYALPYLEIFIIYLSISNLDRVNLWEILLLFFTYRAINRPIKSLQLDLNHLKLKNNELGVEATLDKTLKFQWLLIIFIVLILSFTKYQNQLNYLTLSLFGFFIFQDLLLHKLRIKNEVRFIISIKIFFLLMSSLVFVNFGTMITPAQLFGLYFIISTYLLTHVLNMKVTPTKSTELLYLAAIEKKKKFILTKSSAFSRIKIINNSFILFQSSIDEHELIHELWKIYPLNLQNSDLKKIELAPLMSPQELKDYFKHLNKKIDHSIVHIFRANQLKYSTKSPSFFEKIMMGSLLTKCFKSTTYLGSKALFKQEKNYYFYVIDHSSFVVVEKKHFSENDLRLLDAEKMKFIGYSLL
jgi:hypothetical protein